MNAVVERAEHSQVTLKVEVEPERLAKATDKAYQRLVQRVNIPGFRRGKAPRRILERTVGLDALYREALDFVMPSAYEEAVKANDIAPYTQPEFEVVQLEPEKTLIFKATVPVQPQVTLGDYKTIAVEPPASDVGEDELAAAVENVRNAHGEWAPVEDRPVQMGDQVSLDVLTSLDGRALGDAPRDVVAELDADNPVPGWANALAGLNLGDKKDVDDPIRDDYRDENLAGKTATYHVTVKGIKRRELPDIDDELARSVGDYDGLEAMKADLRQRLERQKKVQAKEQFEAQVVDKLVEISEIEYPAVMVEQELDQMLREADANFRRQGFSLDLFLRASRREGSSLRQEWQPRAVNRIKSALVLREYVRAEGIEVSAEDLNAELQRLVDDTPADRRGEVQRLVQTDRARTSVADELALRRALDTLDTMAGGEQFVNVGAAGATLPEADEEPDEALSVGVE